MTTFFCPRCWAEVAEADPCCPTCGADLQALDAEPFPAKLTRAVWSPEPLTARRAVEILGRLGEVGSVDVLLSRYRTGVDPYLAADIATALGRIGGAAARAGLQLLAADPSFIVRRSARLALGDAP